MSDRRDAILRRDWGDVWDDLPPAPPLVPRSARLDFRYRTILVYGDGVPLDVAWSATPAAAVEVLDALEPLRRPGLPPFIGCYDAEDEEAGYFTDTDRYDEEAEGGDERVE